MMGEQDKVQREQDVTELELEAMLEAGREKRRDEKL